jgi:hypothetical protein
MEMLATFWAYMGLLGLNAQRLQGKMTCILLCGVVVQGNIIEPTR